MAATGAPSVWARTSKPAGAVLTATPWLIHVSCLYGEPASSPSVLSMVVSVLPYSPSAAFVDVGAERVRHGLEAVADAEHGHAGVEQLGIDARGAGLEYGCAA